MKQENAVLDFKVSDLVIIPQHMRPAVFRYVARGARPGGFLQAILANDFFEAAQRADDANGQVLRNYGTLLTMLPDPCWGSKEAVAAWCERGGLGLILCEKCDLREYAYPCVDCEGRGYMGVAR